MPDHIDELIGEIAKTYHISLGCDDPILMLHLVNARLLRDSAQAQQIQLDRFKSQLEETMHQLSANISEKSERILSKSISASEEVMVKIAQASTTPISKNFTFENNQYSALTLHFLEHLRSLAVFNIGATVIAAIFSFLILITY